MPFPGIAGSGLETVVGQLCQSGAVVVKFLHRAGHLLGRFAGHNGCRAGFQYQVPGVAVGRAKHHRLAAAHGFKDFGGDGPGHQFHVFQVHDGQVGDAPVAGHFRFWPQSSECDVGQPEFRRELLAHFQVWPESYDNKMDARNLCQFRCGPHQRVNGLRRRDIADVGDDELALQLQFVDQLLVGRLGLKHASIYSVENGHAFFRRNPPLDQVGIVTG